MAIVPTPPNGEVHTSPLICDLETGQVRPLLSDPEAFDSGEWPAGFTLNAFTNLSGDVRAYKADADAVRTSPSTYGDPMKTQLLVHNNPTGVAYLIGPKPEPQVWLPAENRSIHFKNLNGYGPLFSGSLSDDGKVMIVAEAAADNRRLERQVKLWDVGADCAKADLGNFRQPWMASFAGDMRRGVIVHSLTGFPQRGALTLFDTASGSRIAEFADCDLRCKFSPDGKRLAFCRGTGASAPDEMELVIADAETGAVERSVSLGSFPGKTYPMVQYVDDRTLCVDRQTVLAGGLSTAGAWLEYARNALVQETMLIDAESLRVAERLPRGRIAPGRKYFIPLNNPFSFSFETIPVYELPLQTPWLKVLGIPLVPAAVVWLALACWRRRARTA